MFKLNVLNEYKKDGCNDEDLGLIITGFLECLSIVSSANLSHIEIEHLSSPPNKEKLEAYTSKYRHFQILFEQAVEDLESLNIVEQKEIDEALEEPE